MTSIKTFLTMAEAFSFLDEMLTANRELNLLVTKELDGRFHVWDKDK